MKSAERNYMEAVWLEKSLKTPVIFRQGKGHRLLIRLPDANDNEAWLRDQRRYKPYWIEQFKCWDAPQAWFHSLIEMCLKRFGAVYIIQPYNEQEKCAPSCMRAEKHICECSCMGANHGAGGPNSEWLVISDAFATRWKGQELACRMLSKK